MTTDSVDIESLQELYQESQVAQFFFDHAAERKKNQTETKVDRVLQLLKEAGIAANRQDVVGLFKAMEETGWGHFIIGRRGWPSRFHWKASIVDVGNAVTGEESGSSIATLEDATGGDLDGEADDLLHSYFLRPDLRVEVSLPEDLTSEEASRFASFIKSLPFDSEA